MVFEEFQIYFSAYISENVISIEERLYRDKEFFDSVCYDCFRIYSQTDVNVDILCKQAENILYQVKRYKPFV